MPVSALRSTIKRGNKEEILVSESDSESSDSDESTSAAHLPQQSTQAHNASPSFTPPVTEAQLFGASRGLKGPRAEKALRHKALLIDDPTAAKAVEARKSKKKGTPNPPTQAPSKLAFPRFSTVTMDYSRIHIPQYNTFFLEDFPA